MTRPLRVFLCHSSNDKPIVRELYKKLHAETWIEAWLDEEELYPGQDWNIEIEKAVEAADAIIVCLSKGSITKEGYVQRELRTVLDFADYKPEGTLYIIPVRLEACEPPRRLRAWQYADYFEGQRERAFQRLLVSLKRRADVLGLMAEELERKKIEEQKRREAAENAERNDVLKKAMSEAKKKARRESKIKKQREFIGRIFNYIYPKLRQFGIGLGIGSIGVLVIIFALLGLNYLFDNLPVAPATVPSPALAIGSTTISEKDGMILLYVPAGEFTMGSDANPDEQPIHQVYLDAFWIDQTEVTNAMYAKCVADGSCKEPSNKSSITHSSYFGNSEFDDYPVIYIDWNQASAYCSYAERRLPTEAEWEKAARSTDARIYPWGNDLPNSNLLNDNGAVGDTTKVRSYESGKSPYGIYDMAGNVYEWVNDWYSETYYQTSPLSNPLGLESGQSQVLRGGSYLTNFSTINSTSTSRLGWFPNSADAFIGFRCARTP